MNWLLRELITESLANSDEADDGSQWQSATDKIFVQIKNQLKPKEGRIIPLWRKYWMRVAAAAILLVGGFWVYHSINSPGTIQPEIAKTDTTSDEIGPGGNKAILTLADGSAINLETAMNGHHS